jgi:hypothetical protein
VKFDTGEAHEIYQENPNLVEIGHSREDLVAGDIRSPLSRSLRVG